MVTAILLISEIVNMGIYLGRIILPTIQIEITKI
jgi:hypothetical protein